MHAHVRTLMLACVLVAAGVGVAACGGGGEEEAKEAARESEWQALQEAKQSLEAKRSELAEVRGRLALSDTGADEAAAEAGGEEAAAATAAEASPEELAARADALEQEIADESETFNERLVTFINDDPIIEGEPPTERQMAAIRMKSAEDMAIAREYIDKAGDHRRAIDIYETALQVDPENAELQAALEEARGARFMTAERFGQVKKGMTQEEVRSLLGTANPRNIRSYPEREVEAWFYPKGGGGAAAVFFQKDKGDAMVVYQIDFEAVKATEGEAEQEA
jgi:tetratricopeptide (TPR) repeat protein